MLFTSRENYLQGKNDISKNQDCLSELKAQGDILVGFLTGWYKRIFMPVIDKQDCIVKILIYLLLFLIPWNTTRVDTRVIAARASLCHVLFNYI